MFKYIINSDCVCLLSLDMMTW